MWKPPVLDKTLPYALLGMTAVTGVVDAVSFLFLGHVFTANMTGNVVLLAFASTGVPEVSVARSLTALCAFLVGAAVGGRILADAGAQSQIRSAISPFGLEIAFLSAATLSAIGYKSASSSPVLQLYALIGLTAVAMGMRNAAVRKLGVPDLTTTVLTLTITGLAADSSLTHGTTRAGSDDSPRYWRCMRAQRWVSQSSGAPFLRPSVLLSWCLQFVVSRCFPR